MVTKKGIQKASEILVKEIKILRELTALHHTNLVAMHDCMDSPAYVYVVMEVRFTFRIYTMHTGQEVFELLLSLGTHRRQLRSIMWCNKFPWKIFSFLVNTLRMIKYMSPGPAVLVLH